MDASDLNFEAAGNLLDNQMPVQNLDINPSSLALFRKRNSMRSGDTDYR